MRVTFVTSGLEHLGISALSAYVKEKGHDVSLVYETRPFSTNSGVDSALLARLLEPSVQETASRILKTRPDVVAFTSYSITHRWSIEVARAIKRERPVPIVFGGPHVSGAPEHSIRELAIDAVVEGEGEGALLDLIHCAEKDRFGRTDIQNVVFRGDNGIIRNPLRPLIQDLDELPYADKTDLYAKMPTLEREYYIISRRGCPYRCSFCEYSLFPKQYPGEKPVRRRSVEHLMGEFRLWKARGNVKKVFIWDAIFTLDTKWMHSFADAYSSEIGIPFECYTHPSVMTREMARQLQRAGCAMVRVGVQTVNGDTLAEMDRRGDARRVEETLSYLREFGLPYKLDHILGLPGEGPEDQREAVRFYNRVRPARITTHWMSYFPGTTEIDRARAAGVLSEEKAEKILNADDPDGFDGPELLEGEHKEELEEVRKLAALLEILPLLPAAAVSWLLDSGNYKYLTRWQTIRHASAFLMGIIDRTEQAKLIVSAHALLQSLTPAVVRAYLESRHPKESFPWLPPEWSARKSAGKVVPLPKVSAPEVPRRLPVISEAIH